MKRYLDILIICAVISTLSACNYTNIKGMGQRQRVPSQSGPGGEDGPKAPPLNFETVLNLAFIGPDKEKPYCTGCHDENKAQGGVDLSSYQGLLDSFVMTKGDPEDSSLYTEVFTGSMPKGKKRLSESEIDLIYNWILEGAPEK